MWSKPPNWQAKVPGTVLFRHRLWRDLPGFHHCFHGVLLFLERRYSVGVKRADLYRNLT